MKIYPVVHLHTPGQALDRVDEAFEAGADGVYLIDHIRGASDTTPLFRTLNMLKKDNPDRYVGINILGLGAFQAYQAMDRARQNMSLRLPDALWVDDMDQDDPPEKAKRFLRSQPVLQSVRLMGGVAFKYTSTYTDDPFEAGQEAKRLMMAVDVVTTSGSSTGSAPSVEKIHAMHDALGGLKLAVASGIDADNIQQYAGIVDEVLAASSIEVGEKYSGIFDTVKLRDLVQAAHAVDL